RGLPAGVSPELWNLEQPDAVRAIHRDYAAAGARLITTNTFGGTRVRLAMHGLDDRVVELNRAGAALAREAADESDALVLASVGPTGELIAPLGTLEPDQAEALFAEQIRGLAEGGADVILVETMSDPAELAAAVRAAQTTAPELEIAATMTFDTHLHTMMGVGPEQALEQITSLGVGILGANCGNGPGEIEAVMAVMAANRPAGVVLLAQSNAGLPHAEGDSFVYDATPQVMAGYALRMRELGVDVIGACCGSTPAHVEAMREALGAALPAQS
ncbi:MAG: homocysteine S-methyltransferase family protein, partial [Gaiellales bacterium]